MSRGRDCVCQYGYTRLVLWTSEYSLIRTIIRHVSHRMMGGVLELSMLAVRKTQVLQLQPWTLIVALALWGLCYGCWSSVFVTFSMFRIYIEKVVDSCTRIFSDDSHTSVLKLINIIGKEKHYWAYTFLNVLYWKSSDTSPVHSFTLQFADQIEDPLFSFSYFNLL